MELYNIEDETWEDIYSTPFKITTDTSLQWFQYRINHRLIPTRKYLIYNEKIRKVENTIKLWKRRYLTPIGKITVIKTLLLPIFYHLLISLPNPTQTILNKLNNIFYDFLWEGPAKIKIKVIIKQYLQGGLNMINLNAFIISLKTTWIRRLIVNDGNWSNIIKEKIDLKHITVYGEEYIQMLGNKIKTNFGKMYRIHIQNLSQ